jgi:hypothetical protein
MDKLILIPLLLAALYFLYRYVRNTIKGEIGCHGNCARCTQELKKKGSLGINGETCIYNGFPFSRE